MCGANKMAVTNTPKTPIVAGHGKTSSGLPLLKRFRTEAGYYAYDANTGVILRLDEITYKVLGAYGGRPRADLKASLTTQFAPDKVACALSHLEEIMRSGVFHPLNIRSRLASPEFVAESWPRMAASFEALTLSVTEQCNMRCRYCVFSGGYENRRVHTALRMSWEVAHKAMDFFFENRGSLFPNQRISFYGGEPTINIPMIARCVQYARSKDASLTFGMTTNGTLLAPRVREFLAAENFSLLVSLDGPEEIHNRNRLFLTGEGSFETVIRNLRALKEAAPDYYRRNVRFSCVLSPDTDLRRVIEFFTTGLDLFEPGAVEFARVAIGHKTYFASHCKAPADNGADDLETLYLQKVVKGDLDDREFAFLRNLFEEPYVRLHRRPIRLKGWGEDFHFMTACFPGGFKLFVQADGTFLVCEKANNALQVGNVERGLDGKKISGIYRAYYALYNSRCRRCWAVHFCPSCYVTATRQTGSFAKRLDPGRCHEVRRYWAGILRHYAEVYEQNPHALDYLDNVLLIGRPIPVLDYDPSDICKIRAKFRGASD